MNTELLARAIIVAERIKPRPITSGTELHEMQDAMTEAICLFPELVTELQTAYGQLSTLKH